MSSKFWKTHDYISWLNLEHFNFMTIGSSHIVLKQINNFFQDLRSGVDFHIQLVGRRNMLVTVDWTALNSKGGMKVSSSLECKPLQWRVDKTKDFI